MKRGIAGSLIFLMFDRHAILHGMRSDPKMKFISDVDEIRPDITPSSVFHNTQKGQVQTEITTNLEAPTSSLSEGWKPVDAWYSDQLPSFNIVLAGVNELGAASVMSIYGVEILNEGYGISIDDIVSEQQMTYVARAISPWTPLETPWLSAGEQSAGEAAVQGAINVANNIAGIF